MALFLYRLGRMAFLHRRLVLGLWVLILVAVERRRGHPLGPDLHQLLHPRHRGPGGDRHAPGAVPGRRRLGCHGAGRVRGTAKVAR